MKTIRRDKLKRLIENNKLIAKCKYRMTDDYAWDNANNFGKTDYLPCALESSCKVITNQDGSTRYFKSEGVLYFSDFNFKSSSGGAYENPDGTITFKIHGNESYCLAFKDKVS